MSTQGGVYAVDEALAARTDLHDAYQSNARLLFALQLRFDIDDVHSVAIDALVDGPEDKCCDLVYIDRDSKRLIVAQGYEAADAGKGAVAKTSKARDLNAAAAWLFSGDTSKLNERLRPVAQEVRTAIGDGEIEAVEFWYVHNRPESRPVADELRTVEAAVRNALRDTFSYASSRIPQEIIALEVGMGKQEEWYRSLSAPILVTETIAFQVPGFFEVAGDNWKAVVTAIPARRLRELYDKHKSELFSANYRDYLGSLRPRNREDINSFIRQSAELTPGKFWVFNNGVSAIVNQFTVDTSDPCDPKVTIQGLSIVNGAQTTGSVGTLPQPPDAKAFVPIRFIHCSDGETIADIVRFNNSQNPLLPADYKSNDQVQRRLREEFSRIPESRYTGGRRGLPVDRVSPPGADLPTDTCAQALAAFHQRPDIAYHRKGEIWREDAVYRDYFSEKTTARHIVFAYALLKSVEGRKKRLRDEAKGSTAREQIQKQLDFFANRGSSFLLAAAVAKSLETILSRAIPNPWLVSFEPSVGPAKSVDLWSPIVDVLNPHCTHLSPSATAGVRDQTQVRNDIDQFCSIVESIKEALQATFTAFAEKVQVGG